ncbi:hypothetical protein C0989_002954 [Termitomyces sp. Mn162]|nr:hypothetical protein C0989_002954 [Termitomyces sp. Mn162]
MSSTAAITADCMDQEHAAQTYLGKIDCLLLLVREQIATVPKQAPYAKNFAPLPLLEYKMENLSGEGMLFEHPPHKLKVLGLSHSRKMIGFALEGNKDKDKGRAEEEANKASNIAKGLAALPKQVKGPGKSKRKMKETDSEDNGNVIISPATLSKKIKDSKKGKRKECDRENKFVISAQQIPF